MKILFQNVRKGVIGGESSATWGSRILDYHIVVAILPKTMQE